MSASVLVATPHAAFGELIRLSLEEEGRYQVRLVSSAREAAAAVVNPYYRIVILDCDLPDLPLAELSAVLLHDHPGLKLVLIPPENDPQHPAVRDIPAHGYLSRPFYLPDLLDLLAGLDSAEPPPPAGEEGLPVWVDEQALEHLLANSTAEGGIILHRSGAQVVRTSAAEALKAQIERLWEMEEATDVVRFARLSEELGERILYVTALTPHMALGLVYPLKTPLSRIRTEALQMTRTLTNGSAPASPEKTVPPQPRAAPASPAAWLPETLPPEEETAEEDLPEQISLADLLGDVPPPDPQPATEWVPEIDLSLPRVSVETPAPPIHEAPAVEAPPPPEPEPAPAQSASAETLPALLPEEEELAVNHATVLPDLTSIQQIEPVSTAFSQIFYTCVLIPRLPSHFLTGALGEQVSQRVQQLCLAFGWRLEGIAVRPQYMQWSVQVSPSIAPATLIRVIRQRTSSFIFEHFPALAEENPSGDFWASGYLIVSGPQPPSPRLLRDYIEETRRRQGVLLPSSSDNLPRLSSSTDTSH
ncbi:MULTISPECIES: transposase [Anaerolinea]|uniref:transposase n=1 Tax=Anaerolinea TaxID=233189 RepID=UPI0026159E03|nr:transposase [Anaerolinea thermophila]